MIDGDQRPVTLGGNGSSVALIDDHGSVTYAALAAARDQRATELTSVIEPGSVVAVKGDFSRAAIIDLLALIHNRCIAVPISQLAGTQARDTIEVSHAQFVVDAGGTPRPREARGEHPHYEAIRQRRSAGLVLFSSGTSGRPKGTVHDFDRLVDAVPQRPMAATVVAFLLYDHIGGINTLLQVLRGGGSLALPPDRSPTSIARTIERTRATVLPASPSFLAMLISSGAASDYDLSSLGTISYGSEVMPPALLSALTAQFPDVRFRQLYGMSETGILHGSSESNESTWLRLGSADCELRVVDGLLEIRKEAMMLGYLDAPSPFTDDGWLQTMDRVEVRGDLYRVLGRESDMINVGGLKVLPQEVEQAILSLAFVADCVVLGTVHPLSGQTVTARVALLDPQPSISEAELRSRLRRDLAPLLDQYKIPTRVEIVTDDSLMGERLKKSRRTV